MSIRGIAIALSLTPLVCSFSSPAQAQAPPGPNVKVGDTVWVTVAQDREVKGLVTNITPTAIEVRGETGTQQLNLVEVRKISKPDSLKNGFLIGAAVGVASGIGYAYDSAAPDASEGSKAGYAVFSAALGVAMYGSLGRWIDKRNEGRQIVYEKPASSTHVALSPIVSRRALGLGGSIRW
jgi:hypothetical protein